MVFLQYVFVHVIPIHDGCTMISHNIDIDIPTSGCNFIKWLRNSLALSLLFLHVEHLDTFILVEYNCYLQWLLFSVLNWSSWRFSWKFLTLLTSERQRQEKTQKKLYKVFILWKSKEKLLFSWFFAIFTFIYRYRWSRMHPWRLRYLGIFFFKISLVKRDSIK